MVVKDYKTFSQSGINNGDKVVVIYEDSKDFMKSGKIVSITLSGINAGDCSVLMDHNQKIVEYYYSNLIKIEHLVEIPTGEVFNVPYNKSIELAIVGLIKYNVKYDYYYFDENDKWQIEKYVI